MIATCAVLKHAIQEIIQFFCPFSSFVYVLPLDMSLHKLMFKRKVILCSIKIAILITTIEKSIIK